MTDLQIPALQPDEVTRKMADGDTFVLNVITDWCPDCTTRQRPNLPRFVSTLAGAGIKVFQLTAQHQRLVFVTENHAQMVEQFGGHGYPRTILIVEGNEIDSVVEVMTKDDLSALAERFIEQLPPEE